MFSDARTGIALVLTHVATLLAAAALVLTWIGLGSVLRRRVARRAAPGAITAILLDATLGAGALATLFLGVGLSGALHPRVVVALAMLAAAVGARSGWQTLRALAASLPGIRATPAAQLVSLVAVSAAVVLLAGALGPPTDWDSLMYHLRVPTWYLATGRIALPPDSFHAALIGASHLATLPLPATGLLAGPAVAHVLVLALVLAGTWELARHAGLTTGGRWVAVAALLGCPAVVLGAITARVDVVLLLPLLAAHLALLDARDGDDRLLLLAAIAMGIALAIKPVAAAYGLLLVPLGLRVSRGWRPAVVAALLAWLVALPWIAKTMWMAGAPLYPRGAPGWLEPWLAELFGGRVPPPGFDTSVLRALRESRAPFNLVDAFVAPARLAIEGEGRFYAFSPLLALAPLTLLWWRSHRLAMELALVGTVLALAVIVPFEGANLRYLMPALPPLAVAAASVADRLVRAIAGTRGGGRPYHPGTVAMIAAGVLAIAPLLPATRHRFGGNMMLLRHAAGLSPAREVWELHPDPVVRSFAPAIAAVQREVPPAGRVLLLWEARALPLERDALADVRLSNWSYLAQSSAPERCLQGTDITHVLVNTGALEFYTGRGGGGAPCRLAAFAYFRARCVVATTRLHTGFELLTLGWPGDANPRD